MIRRGLYLALVLGVFAVASPAAALANHVNGVSYSNLGSPQGIAHRSPTGTANKLTHDGVNYGKVRVD